MEQCSTCLTYEMSRISAMLDDVCLNVGNAIVNVFSTSDFSNCDPFHT